MHLITKVRKKAVQPLLAWFFCYVLGMSIWVV